MRGARNVGIAVASLAAAGLIGAGCSASTGTVAIELGGEQAAEVGWPFEVDGETIGFSDGWSMSFDRVLVSVDGFALAGGDGERVALEVDPVIADLHGGPVQVYRFEGVPARRWDDVSWSIVPATSGARLAGGARSEDAQRMIDGGLAILIEGTATHPVHGDVGVSIGVPGTLHNQRCEQADGTLGVVVPASGVARAQLTFHLDHVFFDSLGEREPALRFEAWAAAAGDDDVVTLDDLASQPLADLRGIDGMPLQGAPYDPGSVPLPSPDLGAFVREAITTIGHLDGEGHCHYERE